MILAELPSTELPPSRPRDHLSSHSHSPDSQASSSPSASSSSSSSSSSPSSSSASLSPPSPECTDLTRSQALHPESDRIRQPTPPLGSPVALKAPKGVAGNLALPLVYSSPIQETLDLSSDLKLPHPTLSSPPPPPPPPPPSSLSLPPLATPIDLNSPLPNWLTIARSQLRSIDPPILNPHKVSPVLGSSIPKSLPSPNPSADPPTGIFQSDQPTSRMERNIMLMSMNKSEPNLLHPSSHRSFTNRHPPLSPPPPPISSTFELENFSAPSFPPQPVKHHRPQFSLSDLKRIPPPPQVEASRNPTSTHHHPSIRSILNQTSKRISQFTSRLHPSSNSPSPSSPPHLTGGSSTLVSAPHSPKSPITVPCSKHDAHHQPSSDLPGSGSPPLPTPSTSSFTSHPTPPPTIPQISPPAHLGPKNNKFKRNNTRIHSPNFYQSLKSRWRPEPVIPETASGFLTCPVPKPMGDNSMTYPSFENVEREQKKCLSSAVDHDDCPPKRSSLQDVTQLISSRAATEILRSRSQTKLGAGHKVNSQFNLPGIQNPMASQSPPVIPTLSSRLRALSTSSAGYRKPDFGPLLPFQLTDKQFTLAVQKSKLKLPPSTAAGSVAVCAVSKGTHVDAPLSKLTWPSSSEAGNTLASIASKDIHVDSQLLHRSATAPPNPSQKALTELSGRPQVAGGSLPPTCQPKPQLRLNEEPDLDGPSNRSDDLFPIDLQGCNEVSISESPSSPDQDVSSGINQVDQIQTLPSANDPIESVPHQHSPQAEQKVLAAPESIDPYSNPFTYPEIPGQPDEVELPEMSEAVQMAIAEDLHHKNHANFASRRSSISMVLKRQDSVDASTPVLFQGIWEKELEENERKWKRLARMSGSQSSSIYSSQSHPEPDDQNQGLDCPLPVITRPPSNSVSGFSIKPNVHSSALESSEPLTEITQTPNEVLDLVWDSFKSDAELSLSDINCDGSLNTTFTGSDDDARHSIEPLKANLPALERIKEPIDSSCFTSLPSLETSRLPNAKPVGLGLFNTPCDPVLGGNVPMADDTSPITSPKLKKLSLLSKPTSSIILESSKAKGKYPSRKANYKTLRPRDLEINSSSLDLSLLNAFPAPPSSHRSSQSSSSSHSLKALTLSEAPWNSVGLSSAPTSLPGSLNKTKLLTQDRLGPQPSASHQSKLDNSRKILASFKPMSFSTRPRAQTAGRCPIPPPLNLKTLLQQPPLDHRRRTMTANLTDHDKTQFKVAPPVPLLAAPNTAPLASRPTLAEMYHEGAITASLSAHSSSSVLPIGTMHSKSTTGGMTPRRPSLVIGPNLRSPRRVPQRLAACRFGHSGLATNSTQVISPMNCSLSQVMQPNTQNMTTDQKILEKTGHFTSPHASAGSSTGTTSSSSTVPSPATPTSLGMAYNSRLPLVPMHHHVSAIPLGLRSPVKSIYPSENTRYVMIEQTPKPLIGERVVPQTIKASRIYRPEVSKPSSLSQHMEEVSYGMAL